MDKNIQFQNYGARGNWVANEWVPAKEGKTISIISPYFDKEIATVPDSSAADLDAIVDRAQVAFPGWAATNIRDRAQIMFRFKTIMENDIENLAELIALDNGKTVADAKGSIQRGIDVIEYATTIPEVLKEESSQVSAGITCTMTHEPLGVVAGITPFNFPVMVPLWMIPLAITAGNCFILKPSEQTPLAGLQIAEYLKEAGLPTGVFSVVNGSREAVEGICDHIDIRAVAFVGSSKVAKIVYTRSTAVGKRALCLGGAKNHIIIVPDADENSTAKGLLASSMGSAGQRCMAASVMVGVEEVDAIIDSIVESSAQLKLGEDMGAVISKAARERIIRMIDEAKEQGARIVLDGRNPQSPEGYDGGYWLGPTIIDHASPEMACAQVEIFGPVLTIVRADSLKEAMKIENSSPYGNAASIFTTSGAVSRYVSENASAGMVGINVGVPVPRDPFSFGGWNQSKFGHGDITGSSGLSFWTNLRKVTTRWPAE